MSIGGTRWSAAGADVTDEAVACTEAVTRNAVTYYRGWLRQMPERSVIGSTDPDYGVWSAVSKGGTRQTVVESTLPASGTQIGIDLATGEVLSTTSRTVYARYVGHGDFWAPQVLALPIYIPGMTTQGVTEDLGSTVAPVAMEVTGYSIEVALIGGAVPDGDVELDLRDATGGGGNAAADTLDLVDNASRTAQTALSAGFVVSAGANLTVRGDGQGMQGVTVYLYGRAL